MIDGLSQKFLVTYDYFSPAGVAFGRPGLVLSTASGETHEFPAAAVEAVDFGRSKDSHGRKSDVCHTILALFV